MSDVLHPGIHAMTAEAYHADPCPAPSLSSSIAHLLCTASPKHAWAAHPRLNPNFTRETDDKFDLGSAAHDVLLEGAERVTVVEAADWRTKDAKAARDIARAKGRIPILSHQWARVAEMVSAVRVQLDAHQDGIAMFEAGQAEQTLVWQEPDFGGIWCRARVDYLRGVGNVTNIDDLKTTAASANPDTWTRTLFAIGADIQTAFYLRGLKMLTGIDASMRYAVVEVEPPYALSVIALGPAAMTLGEKKVLWALEQWQRCTERNEWPGYPTRTCYADLPAYLESQWLEKELR